MSRPTYFILGAAASVIVLLWLLPEKETKRLTSEGNLVEGTALAFFGLTAMLAAIETVRFRSRLWLAVFVLLLGVILRELDVQKMFTERSTVSLGFYSNPTIPLSTKMLAILAFVPFFATAIYLARGWRQILGLGQQSLSHLVLAFCFGMAARLCEKLKIDRQNILEEVFELVFAGLILMAVAKVILGSKATKASALD